MERGITTATAAKKFFRPQLPDLYDPFLMKDMDVAVERLNKAMGKKERILIYGDYDVDGTTAVALVYKFIQQFYSNIDYYIPDRYNEGYGVSTQGVDYASETGVGLIIVLDCGIKAVDEIAYAKEKGIDFIICDHHVPDEILPPAVAILMPNGSTQLIPIPICPAAAWVSNSCRLSHKVTASSSANSSRYWTFVPSASRRTSCRLWEKTVSWLTTVYDN